LQNWQDGSYRWLIDNWDNSRNLEKKAAWLAITKRFNKVTVISQSS
jgi:hypothetical protein